VLSLDAVIAVNAVVKRFGHYAQGCFPLGKAIKKRRPAHCQTARFDGATSQTDIKSGSSGV
jgi:hypothetical protein